MIFTDALTIDAPRTTSDGYMAVRARAAKSGVYQYLGAEVDPSGTKFKPHDTVNVYRPESEVFDTRSVHSFLMKPITDDHPHEAVTADNWRNHAKGVVAKAMRDGDHLAFDLVLMDRGLIDQVQSGKRELSNGYSTDLKFEDGIAPDGTAYQAVQRQISGNHVAVVDRGRAGPDCRIADRAAICDKLPQQILDGDGTLFKIIRDGVTIEVNDAYIATLDTKIATLTSDIAGLNTQVGTLTATVSTKDGEIAALKQKLTDAEMTPAKLDAAVKARAAVVDAAKEIAPTLDTAKLSEAEIRKAVVDAKLPNHGLDDNGVAGAFAALIVAPRDNLRDSVLANKVVTGDTAAATRNAVRAARFN